MNNHGMNANQIPFGAFSQPANGYGDTLFLDDGCLQVKRKTSIARKTDIANQVPSSTSRFKPPPKRILQSFTIRDPKIEKVFSCAIPREEADKFNVEWLFNEYAKWRMVNIGDDISLIACLKTVDAHINYDCLLTKPFVALSAFPLALDLEPYYVEPIDRVDFKAFKVLRIVGEGAFAKVAVVRRKDTGMIFAMKILKKGNFENEHKDVYIFSEKNILTLIDHPHLVLSSN